MGSEGIVKYSLKRNERKKLRKNLHLRGDYGRFKEMRYYKKIEKYIVYVAVAELKAMVQMIRTLGSIFQMVDFQKEIWEYNDQRTNIYRPPGLEIVQLFHLCPS